MTVVSESGMYSLILRSRKLDDDERCVITNDGTSGNPNRAIVSESGLYSLILRSRKPEAKAFKIA